jgi:leucyl-tRNA synthetase
MSSPRCGSKEIFDSLVVLLAPFAPHIAEELWHKLGHDSSVCDAQWPVCNEDYLKEDTVRYAISFNGKVRFNMDVPAGTSREEMERLALADEASAKWLEGKTPRKVIVVPGKIVNIVL